MRPFAHWASFSLISVPSLLPLLLTAFDFLWMILLAAWRLFGAVSSRRGTIRFALAFRNCSFRPRVYGTYHVTPFVSLILEFDVFQTPRSVGAHTILLTSNPLPPPA
jgi:hypothetical protein